MFKCFREKFSTRSKEIETLSKNQHDKIKEIESKAKDKEEDFERIVNLDIPETPVTIAIVGAGERGKVYAEYAKRNPQVLKVVAVNDVFDFKCQKLAEEHNIPPENIFIGDWKLIAKVPKLADAVAICTTDQNHVGPAEAFADLKYHILLEKPMSVRMDECVRIYNAVMRNDVILAVGHILRYTMYFGCMKRIIDSGVLGDVVNIQSIEMIGYWHFAHSFVRGNWHKESTSSFSLLTKCCHDIDIIIYLMGQKCKKISSFGSVHHFNKENKPKEAGNVERCLKCPLQNTCHYSAKQIYIDRFNEGCNGWPCSVVQPKQPIDIENLTEALNTTDYGRCVYEMDNDVCDHQVVNMEFENGATASLTMMAFTDGMIRKTRVFGTAGELEGNGGSNIRFINFRTKEVKDVNPLFEMVESGPIQWSGHGGGDFALMKAFVKACSTGDPSYILTGGLETLESHMYVFAAEESRRTGSIVDIEAFRKKYSIPGGN